MYDYLHPVAYSLPHYLDQNTAPNAILMADSILTRYETRAIDLQKMIWTQDLDTT